MIPRYSRPEMAALWEPEARFRIWLEIETLACEAQARMGLVPWEAAEAIRDARRLRGRSGSTRSRPRPATTSSPSSPTSPSMSARRRGSCTRG